MKLSEQEVLELVVLIYDAAADSAAWPKFFGKLIARINAASGVFLSLDPVNSRVDRLISLGRDEWFLQRFKEYYIGICPYYKALNQLNTGDVLTSDQLLLDMELIKTEYYNDYLLPQNIHHRVVVVLEKHGSSITYVDLQRPKSGKRFGDEFDLTLLGLLLPHLQRANSLNRRLSEIEDKSSLLDRLFNMVTVGVLLIDENERAVFLNERAEEIVGSNKGLKFRRGKLSVEKHNETVYLQSLVKNAVATAKGEGLAPGGTMVLHDAQDSPSLNLLVMPLKMEFENLFPISNRICAVIFASETDRRLDIPFETLEKAYGLTRSEARIAVEIANGHNLNDFVEKFSVSKNTARTQLKAAMQKTGSRRQAELVKIMLTHPAAFLKTC